MKWNKTRTFQEENRDKISLYLNHLAVVYAFLLPINHYAKTAVFFVILILFLIRGNYKFYMKYAISQKVVQAFLLFFMIHIIWLIGSDNFQEGRHMLSSAKNALFPLLFLAFIDIRFSYRMITAFVLGMLFSELISYAIHLGVLPWKLSLFNTVIYRAYNEFDPSPFLHHSHYTAALALVISILIWNVLDKKLDIKSKYVAILFIITGSINLALVGGRIGYFIYITLLILLIIIRYKKKSFPPLILMFIGLSIVANLSYTYSPMVKTRVDISLKTIETLQNDDENYKSSFGNRVGFWKYSSEVIKENFLFGVGTGDHMQEVYEVIKPKHNYLKQLVHPHNEFILVFLEFGIIGLLVFFNIFYQVIKTRVDSEYKKYVLIATSVTILIALFSETFHEKFYFPLWVFLTSVAISKKEWIKTGIKPMNIKVFGIYLFLICLFLIIGKVQ